MSKRQKKWSPKRRWPILPRQRHPGTWLLLALSTVAVVIFSVLLLQVLFNIMQDLRRQGTVAPVIEVLALPKGEIAPVVPAESVPTTDMAEKDELAAFEIDWSRKEIIEQVALLLIEHQRYTEAAALLQRHQYTHAEAAIFVRRLRQRLGQQFAAAVSLEMEALRDFNRSVAAAARIELLTEVNATGVADVDYVLRSLPLSLQYIFAVKVRARLQVMDSGFPAQLMLPLFRQLLRNDALLMYLFENSDITEKLFYADSELQFQRRVNQLLLPHIQTLMARFRNQLRDRDEAFSIWFAGITGEPFSHELMELAMAESDELKLRNLWRKLPLPVRYLWRDRLWQLLENQEEMPAIPTSVQAQNFWLRLSGEVEHEQLQQWICSHPNWREQLRTFDYLLALHQLPVIVNDFGAGRYLASINRHLSHSLQEEKKIFQQQEFDWRMLQKRLGLKSRRPRSLQVYGSAAAGVQQDEWAEVPAARFLAALQYLGRIAPNSETGSYYYAIARLYALNRGMSSE